MPPKPNILFISHSAKWSGAEQSLLAMAKYLRERDFGTVVLLPSPGPLSDKLKDQGIKTLFANLTSRIPCASQDFIERLLSIRKILEYRIQRQVKQFSRLLADATPDLIISNTSTVLHGAVLHRALKIPHLWFIRELLTDGSPWRLRNQEKDWLPDYMVAGSSKLVFNSKLTKQEFSANLSAEQVMSAFDQKANVVYPPITLLPLKDWPARQHNTILHVGQVVSHKGQLESVRGFAEVVKTNTSWRLMFIGPISDRKYCQLIKGAIIKSDLQDKISFMDFCPDPMEKLIRGGILLVPSIAESFGRIIVEGISCRIPIIASKSAGACELLTEGKDFLGIGPTCSSSIASALERLISNEDLRIQLSTKAYQTLLAKYSCEQSLQAIEQLILRELEW